MKTFAAPCAYIRRSVSRAGDEGDTSREFQIEAVRRMAREAGPTLNIIDGDWGVSAAHDHTAQRLAFLSMIEAVERGEVTTIYAYSLDRLARSLEWSIRLLNACERAGTSIVTNEGTFAPGDDAARVTFSVLSTMNENTVRQMQRKAQSAANSLKARVVAGETNPKTGLPYRSAGRKPFGEHGGEDVQVVIDAFNEAGTLNGAASRLNVAGVPTRLNRSWDATTVSRVLVRHGHLTNTVKRVRGAAVTRTYLFSGLLLCTCGKIMTSMGCKSEGSGPVRPQYLCNWARKDARHQRPYQSPESRIFAFVDAAVTAKINDPAYLAQMSESFDAVAARRALDARREDIERLLAKGRIRESVADEELAEIDAEMANVEARTEFHGHKFPMDQRGPDGGWVVAWDVVDRSSINRTLRLAIESIQMGVVDGVLTPVALTWRPIFGEQEEVA